MNYYVCKNGSQFYCLNAINPNYTYYLKCDYSNNSAFLICHQDKSKNPLHRIDGPAFIGYSGNQYWYYHGFSHREDGPADENVDGFNYWCYHGEDILCLDNEEYLKIIKMKAFL